MIEAAHVLGINRSAGEQERRVENTGVCLPAWASRKYRWFMKRSLELVNVGVLVHPCSYAYNRGPL